MLTINFFLILLVFLYALMDLKFLFTPKSETKKFVGSLLKLIFLICIFLMSLAKDENDEKEKKQIAAAYVDSLKKFSKANTDSLAIYNQKNRDSLKHFSDKNADSLKIFSSNIVKLLAEYHLKYDSSTNSLKRAIDTSKGKSEPEITYLIGDEALKFKQSNDTTYIYTSLYNNGLSKAKNVKCEAYYLYASGNKLFEYFKPFCEIKGLEIGSKLTVTIEQGSFLEKWRVNEIKGSQYIIILGTYQTEEGKQKQINLYFTFDLNDKKWKIFPKGEDLEKEHFRNDLTYFGW